MWGNDVGSLAIAKRYSYNPGGIVVIYNLTGSQADGWLKGQYPLTDGTNTNNFEVC